MGMRSGIVPVPSTVQDSLNSLLEDGYRRRRRLQRACLSQPGTPPTGQATSQVVIQVMERVMNVLNEPMDMTYRHDHDESATEVEEA